MVVCGAGRFRGRHLSYVRGAWPALACVHGMDRSGTVKKVLDKIAGWFGYVPVADLYMVADRSADEVQREAAERRRVVWEAEQAQLRATAVQAGHLRVIGRLLDDLAVTRGA